MQKRCPSLCSWCEWCISEGKDRFNREAITYCLYDHYTNDGEDNYPDIDSCQDFKIDPDMTMVELAWWPISWAADEIRRLSIKKSLLELQGTEQYKTQPDSAQEGGTHGTI